MNGSLLPAAVISVYCAYVCFTGLSSEPRNYECNGLNNHVKQVSTGTLILGMLTTVLSVVYSAVRAGSSTTFLSPPSSPKSGISWFIAMSMYYIVFRAKWAMVSLVQNLVLSSTIRFPTNSFSLIWYLIFACELTLKPIWLHTTRRCCRCLRVCLNYLGSAIWIFTLYSLSLLHR